MPVTGREATLAFGLYTANSWGVATSVTARVLFDSDRGLTSQVGYIDDSAFGQQFLGPADVGDFAPVDATLAGQNYFDHFLYRLEACAFGSPVAVTAVSSQGAANSLVAYQHILDLAPNINGRGVTMASDKVQYVEELTSAKVDGVGFGVGQNGVLTTSFRLKGGKSTAASAVNTRSTVAASATNVTISNRILRQNGTILLNAVSATSLTPGTDTLTDAVDITVDVTRPLDEAMVHGQNFTVEPLDNGFPEVNVRMSFARATTPTCNSLYAAVQAGTPFKLRAIYTGAYINSATQRRYEWEFPYLEARALNFSVEGATQARPDVVFVAKQATTAPTGFTHTRPCRLTRITTQSLVAF